MYDNIRNDWSKNKLGVIHYRLYRFLGHFSQLEFRTNNSMRTSQSQEDEKYKKAIKKHVSSIKSHLYVLNYYFKCNFKMVEKIELKKWKFVLILKKTCIFILKVDTNYWIG